MLHSLPMYVSLVFGLITIGTLLLFYRTIKNSTSEPTSKKANTILLVLIAWLIFQAVLTLKGLYNSDTTAIPPKIVLFGIFPAVLTIILLFATHSGRRFIDSLPLSNITYLNIIRIPVELILLVLFLNKAVPQIMTFEGRNLDIISGITAPFVAYFGITKGKLSRKIILAWNFICLALLLNIVVIALLSTPSPFQKFAFDQPNIAVLNFPFSWLPTFIVPVVLFGHLVSIRRLINSKK